MSNVHQSDICFLVQIPDTSMIDNIIMSSHAPQININGLIVVFLGWKILPSRAVLKPTQMCVNLPARPLGQTYLHSLFGFTSHNVYMSKYLSIQKGERNGGSFASNSECITCGKSLLFRLIQLFATLEFEYRYTVFCKKSGWSQNAVTAERRRDLLLFLRNLT